MFYKKAFGKDHTDKQVLQIQHSTGNLCDNFFN